MKPRRVVIGLSGGVDSAVSAHLLQQQGYEVIAVFMQNWSGDADDPYCTAQQDLRDAKAVSEHLNIEFQVVNFAQQYWDNVFSQCLDEFQQGRTPNPDIGCNKEIKFKALLDFTLSLGADLLATGHYAAKIKQDNLWQLHQGQDLNKDQSYFLYTLNQYQLSHACFPLANLSKPQVRDIAHQIQLPNRDKKDSTGICFIGERRFKQFLQEFILAQPGPIVTTDNQVIGQHDGLMFYTLGQRRGINIGGQRQFSGEAWYVIDKDLNNNRLIVGQGKQHPRLLSPALCCNNLHWINATPPQQPISCCAKARYRQAHQNCVLHPINATEYAVEFSELQRAITPGQAIVFYDQSHCLGGATIHQSMTQEELHARIS